MKLEVGMYVRTSCGLIAKVQSINEYKIAILNTCCNRNEDKYFTFPNEDKIYEIKKASFNLIDLIEVGDYVNGLKIEAISKDTFIKGQTNVWTNQIYYDDLFGTISKVKFTDNNIKEILTHEMFEANCYKVVE